jgi:hypothetical protein
VLVYFREDFFSIETVRLQPLFAAEASSQGLLLYQRADCLLLTVVGKDYTRRERERQAVKLTCSSPLLEGDGKE